jgi:tripartite-type tricarboxylate transporter receptor subunit TctC
MKRLDVTLASVLVAWSALAYPSTYPDRSIQIVVPFAAGGGVDTVARLLAEQMSADLKTPVIVQNVPGAAGQVGALQVASAPADGYKLVMGGDAALVVNVHMQDKPPFDARRDFAPISQVVTMPNILVIGNEIPARDVSQLVQYVRARPGQLSYGSSGIGTSQHRAGEMFKRGADIDLVHVPYTTLPFPDVIAGRITFYFGNVAAVLPLAREGRLRALAVSSRERLAVAPEFPTMAESGFPDFEAVGWFGLLAPAKTPPEIVQRLHEAVARALRQPVLRDRLPPRYRAGRAGCARPASRRSEGRS